MMLEIMACNVFCFLVGYIWNIDYIKWSCCLILLTVLIWNFSVNGEAGRKSRRKQTRYEKEFVGKTVYKKCGFSLAVVALIFGSSAVLSEAPDIEPDFHKIAARGAALEERLRYGKDTDSAASMGKGKQDGILRLRVTMQEPGNLYLKGFCGTVYEDGRWIESPEKSAEESSLLFFLKLRNFDPELQLSKSLSIQDADSMNEVEIETVEASRKYWYFPELLSESGNETFLKSTARSGMARTPGLFGRKHYSYRTVKADYGKAWSEALLNTSDTLKEKDIGEDIIESREEKLYREYVYRTCLDLPAGFEDTEAFPLAKIGGETPLEVVQSVEAVTETTADPFRRVSDAVLLLRYAGMPARYVEGYLVRSEKEKEEIRVTDEDLTAWAEVYADGLGFVPVFFEEPSENTGLLPTVTEEKKAVGSEKETKSETLSGLAVKAAPMFPKNYLWICLAAGILAETGMLLWLRRKEEKAERTEIGGDTGKETETAGRLSEMEVPSGQAALCEEVKRMLENHGICIDFCRPYACGEEIERKLGKEMRKYVDKILYSIDKARFGKPTKG